MRLNEISYSDGVPVDGYGPGFFRIAGELCEGPQVILPSGPGTWGGYEDLTAISEAAEDLDVLFVGTGPETAHLPSAFRTAIEDLGVGVEAMASPAACRTYNILLSEGRRVGLAALPV